MTTEPTLPIGVQAGPQGPQIIHGPPPSAVAYRIAGHWYPAKTVAQCATCQSPFRSEIERGLLEGRSYTTILGHLPGDHRLTPKHLSEHIQQRHLPIDIAVRRAIAEERAREMGTSIEDAVGTIVDQRALAKMVVTLGFERIAKGEIKVGVEQALQAANLIEQMERNDEDSADAAAMGATLHKYMEAVNQVLTPEQQTALGALLRAQPEFRDMAHEGEVIEVEVIELEEGDD